MSLLSFLMRMAVGVALCALPVAAQNIHMAATIPFDFEMSNISLPAGEYRVVREIPANTITVQSVDFQHNATALIGICDSLTMKGAPTFQLVFLRYGSGPEARSFLRRISSGLTKVELPQSRSERDAEAAIQVANSKLTEVVIVAKKLR